MFDNSSQSMLQITAGGGGRKSLNLSRKLKVDCFSCFIRWQDSLLEKISVSGRYILYFECWSTNSVNDSLKELNAKMYLKCFSEEILYCIIYI